MEDLIRSDNQLLHGLRQLKNYLIMHLSELGRWGKKERKRKACLAVTNDCSYFGLYKAQMSVILPRLRVCVDGHEESLRPTAVSRSLPIVIRQTLHAK